jgi:hypothetical protein
MCCDLWWFVLMLISNSTIFSSHPTYGGLVHAVESNEDLKTTFCSDVAAGILGVDTVKMRRLVGRFYTCFVVLFEMFNWSFYRLHWAPPRNKKRIENNWVILKRSGVSTIGHNTFRHNYKMLKFSFAFYFINIWYHHNNWWFWNREQVGGNAKTCSSFTW